MDSLSKFPVGRIQIDFLYVIQVALAVVELLFRSSSRTKGTHYLVRSLSAKSPPSSQKVSQGGRSRAICRRDGGVYSGETPNNDDL